MKRLPIPALLLAAVVTFLIALVSGQLYRVPVYGAGITAVSKEANTVSVLFYGKRFDSYRAEGHLTVPPNGWKITRTADFVRLDNLGDAPPLLLSPGDAPMQFGLLRHPWGGVADVDGLKGGYRRVDLKSAKEMVEPFQIGGTDSVVAPQGARLRFAGAYSVPLLAVTFLLLVGVAWNQWPSTSSSADDAARQPWADLARTVAIFGVVLIHTCGPKFYQYGQIPIAEWQQLAFLDALVRCSVPLFVMLSGALLLKPGEPAPGLRGIGRRVRKLLLPLVLWSVAYLLYKSYVSQQPVDWASPLHEPAMYHLWFVYMIIGLYLVLPVLQGIANAVAARRDLQVYLLLLWLVLTTAPLYVPVPLLQLLQQTSLLGYGGYFLLGAFLASRPASGPSWAWALLFAVAVLATYVLTWQGSDAAGRAVETAFQYFSLNVVAASLAAFVLLTRVRPRGRLASLVQWIADRSFLVFFVHVLILERTTLAFAALELPVPAIAELLAVAVATFVLCLACAAALRVIPRAREVTG